MKYIFTIILPFKYQQYAVSIRYFISFIALGYLVFSKKPFWQFFGGVFFRRFLKTKVDFGFIGREGLEPSRDYSQQILSLVCLPLPPPSHKNSEEFKLAVTFCDISSRMEMTILVESDFHFLVSQVSMSCCFWQVPLGSEQHFH